MNNYVKIMNYTELFSRYLSVALLVVVLLLAQSCQSEEAADDASLITITFQPMLDGQPLELTPSFTRVEDIDLKKFGFTVCGYQTASGTFEEKGSDQTPDVFANMQPGTHFQKVSYNTENEKYMTLARPWVAAPGNFLSFFTWSDNETGDPKINAIVDHSPFTTKGYPWIDVTVANDIMKQADVVAAQASDLSNNALISAIDLNFRHILSKISFKGYSSSGAGVTITKFNITYSGNTKPKGRYTFNATGQDNFEIASDATAHSGSFPIASTFQPITSGRLTPASAQYLGNMMQIPQETLDEFITANITYKIIGIGDSEGPEVTRNVPIKKMTLKQGHHYSLAFDFASGLPTTEIKVSVNAVSDWNEMGTSRLPLVAGPKGDMLLWLDAGDKPYPFEGKQYWLDRSGYNHHCVQVDKNKSPNLLDKIEYDAPAKIYKFSGNAGGQINSAFQIPDLGQHDEVTVQLLLKLAEDKAYTPLVLSNVDYPTPSGYFYLKAERQFMISLFEDKMIKFDYNPTGGLSPGGEGYERMVSSVFDDSQKKSYSLLTFRRKTGYKSIARNLSHLNEITDVPQRTPVNFKFGYLGGAFNGEIKMVKILKRSIGNDEVEADYAYLKKLHNLPDDIPIPLGKLPSAVSGAKLLAYFDGYDSPYVIKNSFNPETIYYWPDRTGNGHHLQIYGYKTTNSIKHNLADHCYEFPGNPATYMKFVQGFGALKQYSIEFGVTNEGVALGTNRVLIHFTNKDGVTTSDGGFMWYFPDANQHLWAYTSGAKIVFDDAESSGPGKGSTWGIGRDSQDMFYVGRVQVDKSNIADPVKSSYVPRLDHCYIGIDAAKTMPFKGKITSIRVYDRHITGEERKAMYKDVLNGIPLQIR